MCLQPHVFLHPQNLLLCRLLSTPEREKPGQQGSIANQKVVAVRKVFLKTCRTNIGYLKNNYRKKAFSQFLDGVRNFWIVGKISQQSGRFPDSLEDFWRVLKISEQSRRFLDRLAYFWTVQKMFQTVWTISEKFRRFPDSLEDFWKVLMISGQI